MMGAPTNEIAGRNGPTERRCPRCGAGLGPDPSDVCSRCGLRGPDRSSSPPEPVPGWEPAGLWSAPGRTTPDRRPRWAIPTFVLGLLVAGGAVFFDAMYLARHLSPNASRYDAFALLPTIVLVPLSAVLLGAGGLALIRPWAATRPWLKVVVVGAVLAWMVAGCFGPGVVTDVQPVL
jgi:hypothetical protein